MERDERIRLFCALRLPDDVLDRLVAWQHVELSGGRIVPRDNLHVTLAFLGHRPASEAATVGAELRAAAAATPPLWLSTRGYRETRSVAMLVFDDEAGAATMIAEDVHARLARLGIYRHEARRWLPHVTVLRHRHPPRLRPRLPELGFAPSDAAVYLSRLRPGGAQYEVLESVAPGG